MVESIVRNYYCLANPCLDPPIFLKKPSPVAEKKNSCPQLFCESEKTKSFSDFHRLPISFLGFSNPLEGGVKSLQRNSTK